MPQQEKNWPPDMVVLIENKKRNPCTCRIVLERHNTFYVCHACAPISNSDKSIINYVNLARSNTLFPSKIHRVVHVTICRPCDKHFAIYL